MPGRKSSNVFRSWFWLLAILISAPVVCSADEKSDFFENRIRPVLVEYCYECHSADSDPIHSGLRVDTRETIRRGGDTGEGIVPGDPESSLLLAALKYEEDDLQMPPSGKLSDDVIADFEHWIESGAFDPRGDKPKPKPKPTPAKTMKKAGADSENAAKESSTNESDKRHWSFRTITKPDVPTQKDLSSEDWPRTDIDRFILRTLDEKKLSPVADADPVTLLRRLSFDLIGLPPTVEQIQAFSEQANSQAAVEKLVDELLASRHFGERWGRHWLDVARFAESTGGGRTKILTDAWRYRDYVIQSFNNDKPFHQFVREQVAGDLLPADDYRVAADQLTGTSFLVLGPTNYELQDKDLLRMEVVDEQLDTIGRAFLGMTIGCARCHDHKFDPIPTRDYYALAGIFRSTKTLTPGNVAGFVERPLPMSPDDQAKFDASQKQTAELKKQLSTIEKQLKKSLAVSEPVPFPLPKTAVLVDNDKAEVEQKWTSSRSVSGYVGKDYIHDDGAEKGKHSVTWSATLTANEPHVVLASYTPGPNRSTNAAYSVHAAEGVKVIRVDQRQTPKHGSFVELGEFRFDSNSARVVLSNAGTDNVVIADAVLFLPVSTRSTLTSKRKDELTPDHITELQAQRKQLRQQINAVESAAPKSARVMSVSEEQEPGDWHIHIRGNIRRLGPVVPRGFLTAANWDKASPPIPDNVSGRLELAHWLADNQNPLTPRVIVNRIWLHLFGRGLVNTPDNFGHMGEAPSHPELLDFLSAEFIADGWSIKRLVRRIVLSRVYQLRSDAGTENDPDNRWLRSQNRRRLDGECLRDAVLFASGQLDETTGGFTVKAGTKTEFHYPFPGKQRSVFVPSFRNTLHPFLEVFDFPNPNLVTGRRTVSTLPSQALYLMNSPLLIEQSRAAAEELLATVQNKDDRLDHAFLLTLGRKPTSDERVVFHDLAAADDKDAVDALSRLFHTLFASLDFRYVR